MYDLWFTLGAVIQDPTILANMRALPQPFQPLRNRVYTETALDGTQSNVAQNRTAGLLTDGNQEAKRLRANIRQSIAALPGAPAVSIFTAGKMSQYAEMGTIDSRALPDRPFDFTKVIDFAHRAHQTAMQNAGAAVMGTAFPALIGLCLIDGKMADRIRQVPAEQIPELREFGLNGTSADPQFHAIRTMVSQPEFLTVQDALFNGNGTPWDDHGCGEQLFFWDGKNERAVL